MKSMPMGWCGTPTRFEMSVTRVDEDVPGGLGMEIREDIGTHFNVAQSNLQRSLAMREAEGFTVSQIFGTVFTWMAEKRLEDGDSIQIIIKLHVGETSDQLGGRMGGLQGTIEAE